MAVGLLHPANEWFVVDVAWRQADLGGQVHRE